MLYDNILVYNDDEIVMVEAVPEAVPELRFCKTSHFELSDYEAPLCVARAVSAVLDYSRDAPTTYRCLDVLVAARSAHVRRRALFEGDHNLLSPLTRAALASHKRAHKQHSYRKQAASQKRCRDLIRSARLDLLAPSPEIDEPPMRQRPLNTRCFDSISLWFPAAISAEAL